MIADEQIRDYINSLKKDIPASLAELEKWAIENGVPIIRKDTQELLRFILNKEKPMCVLEIGAAVGFSTLFIESCIPREARITTIEKVEMRLVHTRKNLMGHENITLLEGDAADILAKLDGSFDLVFLDAAKGQYMAFLPHILRLLTPGGMLLTDNVLLEGSIARSKFAIERRDRTIHMRMREYLYELTHNEMLDTVILPVGDGLSVSIKQKEDSL